MMYFKPAISSKAKATGGCSATPTASYKSYKSYKCLLSLHRKVLLTVEELSYSASTHLSYSYST